MEKSNNRINGEEHTLDLSSMTAKWLKEVWHTPADYMVVRIIVYHREAPS